SRLCAANPCRILRCRVSRTSDNCASVKCNVRRLASMTSSFAGLQRQGCDHTYDTPPLRLRRQFRDAISLSARHGPLNWAASPAHAQPGMVELEPLQRNDGRGGIDLAGL